MESAATYYPRGALDQVRASAMHCQPSSTQTISTFPSLPKEQGAPSIDVDALSMSESAMRSD